MIGPETRCRLHAAGGLGAQPVSVQTVRNHIHAGGFKSRVPAMKQELAAPQTYGFQPCTLGLKQPTMEKDYVLRRVMVLSEAN